MKKFWKKTEQTAAKEEKQPKVKSVLLQTYFTSLLCLVLCVSMFLGTSYAWFTSEVSNTGNEIYIGTLDVDLLKEVPDGEGKTKFVSLDEKNEDGTSKYNLFNKNIRWEPGYTSLETIKVVNEGQLAFKYVLNFTDGTLKDEKGTELNTLATTAAYFDIWMFDHQQKAVKENVITYTVPASFNDVIASGSGWTNVGSLADVLAGKVVLEGAMSATGVATASTEATQSVATEATYTIAVHMSEQAESAIMGQKINLGVKLVAYQQGGEVEVRFASNQEELKEALKSATGDTAIQLTSDIEGKIEAVQNADTKITIDGNGHTFKGELVVDGKSAAEDTAGLVIQNVVFSGLTGDKAYINLGEKGDSNTRYTNHVTIQNCTFIGTDNKTVAIKSYTGGDKNLTISGCTVNEGMHSLAQLKNVEKNLIVSNCTVKSKNGLNVNNSNNLTMSGCVFDVKGYAVRFGADANTTDESFVIENCTLKSACAEAGDAVIEFRAGAVNATLKLVNTTVEGQVKVKGNTTETKITGLN